jgi:disulfide bond formation protein DsbB
MVLSARAIFAFIFAASTALVADAVLYMQGQLGLDPCPMCILHRYAFIAIAAVALVAALHGRAVRVYAGLVVLFSLVGGGIAIRHSYIQHFPPPGLSCGTDLEFLMNAFPLAQALPKIFAGTGDCSAVKWKMLGLSIPEWALVWYVIFAALALWTATRRTAARS